VYVVTTDIDKLANGRIFFGIYFVTNTLIESSAKSKNGDCADKAKADSFSPCPKHKRLSGLVAIFDG
jgi:hypothetical protein